MSEMKVEGSKIPAEDITNPELKEAIEAMQAEGSKQNIDNMINKVIEAKFILPARVTQIPSASTTNGRTVMNNQTQVQFRLLENTKKEKSNVLGFVINPFGKSVTFPKNMVISIKQQRDYMRMENNTLKNGSQIKLGEPKEYPIDMMAALINHFSTEPGVNAAFLRMIEQDGQLSYFIVVDFVGNTQQVFESISEVAQPYLDDEIQLSMMPFSMEFARNAVKGIEPFYIKKEED